MLLNAKLNEGLEYQRLGTIALPKLAEFGSFRFKAVQLRDTGDIILAKLNSIPLGYVIDEDYKKELPEDVKHGLVTVIYQGIVPVLYDGDVEVGDELEVGLNGHLRKYGGAGYGVAIALSAGSKNTIGTVLIRYY